VGESSRLRWDRSQRHTLSTPHELTADSTEEEEEEDETASSPTAESHCGSGEEAAEAAEWERAEVEKADERREGVRDWEDDRRADDRDKEEDGDDMLGDEAWEADASGGAIERTE